MKTAVPQVSHRGTLVEQAGLCSTCVPPVGQQNEARWNARKPLPCLKNRGLFHLGHQKTTYPRICTPQPRCAPVWAFPGRGGNVPRSGSGGNIGARCGNRRTTHPVILNEQRSPFRSACAICTLGEDTVPTGRGIRKQDKAAGHHTRRGPHRTAEPTGKTGVFRGFLPPPVESAQRVKTC